MAKCPWCGDPYEARAWDPPHKCKPVAELIDIDLTEPDPSNYGRG